MIEYILIDTDNGLDINGLPVNLKGKPRLINGNLIQVFNTVEERDLFVSNMPNPFDLDGYKQLINDAHTALYISMWQGRDYMNEAEVMTWEDTLDRDALSLQWKAEAKALLNWYRKTCITVYKYLEDVTEQTALPVDEFIQTLPTL